MAFVELQNVDVEMAVYNARGRGIKQELLRRAVGGRVEDGRDLSIQVIRALQAVSFTARDGDRIGIIGGNGAGKTTLLRVLSRVYPPTGGQVRIEGRVSSLIDLSLGMDTDATGYDNITMRGVMLGLSAKEAEAIVPDVETFSELGPYLSLPIRTYSNGMMLRLAFAVSTAVQPDILILDEIIGVGDAGFAQRAERRMQAMIDTANIVFLASHNDEVIMRFCNRVIWLGAGRVLGDGPPRETLDAYAEQRD